MAFCVDLFLQTPKTVAKRFRFDEMPSEATATVFDVKIEETRTIRFLKFVVTSSGDSSETPARESRGVELETSHEKALEWHVLSF